MEKELMKFETPELQAIEPSKAEQIRKTFEPMAEMLAEFETNYNVVVKESQKEITEDVTKMAKRLRLDIGKVRIETGKIKDKQKEYIKLQDRAIMGVHNILVYAVKEKEDKLKEIENHFEIQEQKRLEKLQADRVAALSKYVEDAEERNLSGMDDDVWSAYFKQKKQDYLDRIEAEKKAEAERVEKERLDRIEYERNLEIAPYVQFIESEYDLRTMEKADYAELLSKLKVVKADHEKEQERIRKENERIKKEQEQERKKIEAERKAREEKERKEREEFEAKLRKEREYRQRIEAEQKKKAEAEEAERKKAERARKQAMKAPDREKLMNAIRDLNIPDLELKSEESHLVEKDIRAKFTSFKLWCETQIKENL